MKYPDALRLLCQAIVEKHLPGEKIAFEVAGELLLDEPASELPTEDLTRAEFGSSPYGDLEIMVVASALRRTTDACIRSKKDSSVDDVIRYWTNNMCKYGLDKTLAGEIAAEFGAQAHAYVVEKRG